jgi:cytochrome b involved in lipid metabolism
MLATSAFQRIYIAVLEYAYGQLPHYRTQPPIEHALRERVNLVGRALTQLNSLRFHDRAFLILEGLMTLVFYTLNPSLWFPGADGVHHGWLERLIRVVAHAHLVSWGMYWTHRASHVHPRKWAMVHAVHHEGSHPLSRITYQSHSWDNVLNIVYGLVAAQVLVPLDYWTYKFFYMSECLEKHSGLSCWVNVVHNLTVKIFPFGHMPHHHDFHHEGSKLCNFTVLSNGGVWDVLFGTRSTGRAQALVDQRQITPHDRMMLAAAATDRREHKVKHALEVIHNADKTDGQQITLAELAEHKDADSMWIAIGHRVYDVTKYAASHPGGEQVLAEVAGGDATASFENVGHSEAARRKVATLSVGQYADAARRNGERKASFFDSPVTVHLPLVLLVALAVGTGAPGSACYGCFCVCSMLYDFTLL